MFLLNKLVLLFKPLIVRFPKVAAMYRVVRDQLDSLGEPQLTKWGFNLAGNTAMANGTFEPIETAFVRKILNEVDILVNVGANVGYYCCHALSMDKRVIAFEPIERNLRYLYKNIKANCWNEVEVFPMALSNHIGILEIYGGDTGASLVKGWAGIAESYKTLVPCSTMDLLLNNRLYGKRVLILMDVEGAEKWVLEGAKKMLNNEPKPIWLMEITAEAHQPNGTHFNPYFKETFEFFFDHGYKAFAVSQNLLPISIEDVDKICNGHLSMNTHNFLFKQ